MSRIKLLFAPENIGFAEKISNALTACGYEASIDDRPAAAALVIWSPAAAASAPILAAARAALARRVLVPVALGKAPPPPSFEHLWPMDLAGWGGAETDPRWRFVLDEIELAVRRGVEIVAPIAPATATPAVAPALAAPRRRPAGPPVASPAKAGDDVFVEPLPAYRQEKRGAIANAPRTAFMVFGAVLLFVGLGSTAFLVGRAQSARTTVAAAEIQRPPTVALVRPETPPADDPDLLERDLLEPQSVEPEPFTDASAPPAIAEVIAGEAPDPFSAQPPSVADAAIGGDDAAPTERPAETLRDASGVEAFLTLPGAAGDLLSSPRLKPPVAMEAQPASAAAVLETPTAPPPLLTTESEADPIAGLAWQSTGDATAETASFGAYLRDCLDCPDLAEIDAGSILPESAQSLSSPPVMLRRRIAIAVRETTFDDWAACVADGVCAPRPDAGWGRGKRPVINVSYDDAQTYLLWLTEKTGRRYRLPTAEEWEYAARAGSAAEYAFSDGLAPGRANYGGRIGATTPAGSFPANRFGLYDMHGNVAEWTADCWTPTLASEPIGATPVGAFCSAHVTMGGAWSDAPEALALGRRDGDVQSARRNNLGFRVARDLN